MFFLDALEVSTYNIISLIVGVLFITCVPYSVASSIRYSKKKKRSEKAMDIVCKGMTRSDVRRLFSHAKMKSNMNMDIFYISAFCGDKMEVKVTYQDNLVINVGYSSKEYRYQ